MFSQDCVKYNILIRWLKKQLENGKEINLNQFDNDPNLVLYIPSLAIANGSYWLKLTVKINQGGEELVFTDSTELVIYEDIYKM